MTRVVVLFLRYVVVFNLDALRKKTAAPVGRAYFCSDAALLRKPLMFPHSPQIVANGLYMIYDMLSPRARLLKVVAGFAVRLGMRRSSPKGGLLWGFFLDA